MRALLVVVVDAAPLLPPPLVLRRVPDDEDGRVGIVDEWVEEETGMALRERDLFAEYANWPLLHSVCKQDHKLQGASHSLQDICAQTRACSV